MIGASACRGPVGPSLTGVAAPGGPSGQVMSFCCSCLKIMVRLRRLVYGVSPWSLWGITLNAAPLPWSVNLGPPHDAPGQIRALVYTGRRPLMLSES